MAFSISISISPVCLPCEAEPIDKFNFGMGICSGGWVGALPLVEGNIIHNTGQDDVFTANFYHKAKLAFDIPEIMFFSNNFELLDGIYK